MKKTKKHVKFELPSTPFNNNNNNNTNTSTIIPSQFPLHSSLLSSETKNFHSVNSKLPKIRHIPSLQRNGRNDYACATSNINYNSSLLLSSDHPTKLLLSTATRSKRSTATAYSTIDNFPTYFNKSNISYQILPTKQIHKSYINSTIPISHFDSSIFRSVRRGLQLMANYKQYYLHSKRSSSIPIDVSRKFRTDYTTTDKPIRLSMSDNLISKKFNRQYLNEKIEMLQTNIPSVKLHQNRPTSPQLSNTINNVSNGDQHHLKSVSLKFQFQFQVCS